MFSHLFRIALCIDLPAMSKPKLLSEEEIQLFRDCVTGARPMAQDKIPPARPPRNKKTAVKTSIEAEEPLFILLLR